MDKKDIRWVQRFNSFSKALTQLKKFIAKGDVLNELEKQGLIQSFEYNFELSWNLIKDYYEYQGESSIQGSRDAFRLGFNRGLIENGELWMKMIESRILTSHSYNQETADEVVKVILMIYFSLFTELHNTMSELLTKQDKLNDK